MIKILQGRPLRQPGEHLTDVFQKLPLKYSIHRRTCFKLNAWKLIIEVMWFVMYDIAGLISVSSYFYTTEKHFTKDN